MCEIPKELEARVNGGSVAALAFGAWKCNYITDMIDFKAKKDFIPGYTGCVPQKTDDLSECQQISANGQIPGYIGYIPSVKPENLFGKTYGKITENCYNGRYHQGIDLPPSVRFTSTVKDTFVDPKAVKDSEAQDGKINGVKVSTFSNAGRTLVAGQTGSSFKQPQNISKLTYEQACKMAYK